ncbi:DUF2971 domain-containing protein [Pseudidiomarina gelatinasegens]|uniref:DUF2971 domain-containing protein n=1 Tax=Pseudidiomarina gelatinasegens TaxID=2487740 RepID=UPI003A97882A
MKLYKYKSLSNLWHTLDVLVKNRLYCAHWSELNDPLEGRYEVYLGEKSHKIESIMTSRIESARDTYRVSSLSADPTNFLMWSHYAEGHKGIIIELEIPENHPDLTKVVYSPFSSVFTDKLQTKEDMRHLFNGKGEEWEYEQEYRIITEGTFFSLPEPVNRVLLGPLVSDVQMSILEEVIPNRIEIVKMELDREQGRLMVNSPNKTIQPTPAPLRFVESADD